MNRGRLIALDAPGELRRRVEVPILEVGVDDAPHAVEALQGAASVQEAAMFGRRLHVMVDDEEEGRRSVRKTLEGSGREVREMRRVPPSLEDVFVALVRREGGAPPS
jgi:ABC-2 type transport system ATP-binding protein